MKPSASSVGELNTNEWHTEYDSPWKTINQYYNVFHQNWNEFKIIDINIRIILYSSHRHRTTIKLLKLLPVEMLGRFDTCLERKSIWFSCWHILNIYCFHNYLLAFSLMSSKISLYACNCSMSQQCIHAVWTFSIHIDGKTNYLSLQSTDTNGIHCPTAARSRRLRRS